MKYLLLHVLMLGISVSLKAQSSNIFTIREIGLSFIPPLGFTLLDSSAYTRKISDKLTIWRKHLLFKNYDNLQNSIGCSITTGNRNEKEWLETRPSETRGSYKVLTTQYPYLKFDSLTTKVIIDGIEFQKFSMVGKGNEQPDYNHNELASFYKGYKVSFIYNFTDSTAGKEIETQLLNSKFEK